MILTGQIIDVTARKASLVAIVRELPRAGKGNSGNMLRRMGAGRGNWCLRRSAEDNVTEKMDVAR